VPALPGPASRAVPAIALAASVVLIVVALSFMRPSAAPAEVIAPGAAAAPDAGHAVSKRVSFRNGLISNARFTNDGRGVAYAGAFEGMPWKVYTGVLDGTAMRSVTANGTILFDVSAGGDLAVGSSPEDGSQKGMVLSRGSLAGGAPRQLYDSVLSADFGPQDVMLLVRLVDSRWVIESPPGKVILTSTENLGAARLSPDGQYIAFPRLPVLGDDRGTVEIIDRTGKLIARSKQAWTLEGLAWNARGDEVWFSAGYEDASRRIYALSLTGAQREVFAAPGNLRLLDVDAQGRALVASSLVRSRMFGKLNGETTERSWSWLDGSMPLDLSPDGKAVLFLEGFGPSTAEVQTWLRRFDTGDDTPVMLSLGWGRALSPDRRWAVVSPTAPFNTLRLVPVGAGAPRDLKAGDFQGINQVRFFPDGQRIVFSAFDHENRPHLYLQSLVAAGKEDEGPQLVNDGEFALTAPPSPDGKYLVGFDVKARKALLVPVDKTQGEAQPLPQLTPGDMPMQWTDDGKRLWIARRDKKLPGISLFQYELGSGKLTPNGVITPADPVGMDHVKAGLITPDGGAYVYTVNQELDELYLIEGVR